MRRLPADRLTTADIRPPLPMSSSNPRASPPSGVNGFIRAFFIVGVVLAGMNFYYVYDVHESKTSSYRGFGKGGKGGSSALRSMQEYFASAGSVTTRGQQNATVLARRTGPAPGDSPALPPTPAQKKKRSPLSRLTVERCQQLPDESELCFYDGPVCWDGDRVTVFTEETAGADPRTSMCYDFRHYEPSYTCAYGDGFGRPGLPPSTPTAVIRDAVPGMASYGNERHNTWGPNGKEVRFREEHPSLLTRSGLRARNVSVLWLRPGMVGAEGGVTTPSSTWPSQWVGPDAAKPGWAEDGEGADALPDEGEGSAGLYFAGFHHSWLDHTWHGAAALMQLWDVKRYNRTGGASAVEAGTAWASDFAGLQPGARQRIRPLGGWSAPPMDVLLIAGKYRRVVGGVNNLMKWTIGLLNVLVSNQTRVAFNTEWEGLGADANHLVCARRGAVLGYKPRMFNSVGDAYAFRLAAYGSLRLPTPVKTDWPPRQITLITRPGARSIINMPELLPIIESFGVPVRWITNMGGLNYAEQVKSMAETGILIGIHGAALANALYLPAHAVLVEMFPYVMYGSMYRDLSAAAGLFYYSIRSQRPTEEQCYWLHEEPFLRMCDGAADANATALSVPLRHVSSSQGFLDYECNWRSKSSYLVIDPDELRYALRQAVDDIGCRDGVCNMGAKGYTRLPGGIVEG